MLSPHPAGIFCFFFNYCESNNVEVKFPGLALEKAMQPHAFLNSAMMSTHSANKLSASTNPKVYFRKTKQKIVVRTMAAITQFARILYILRSKSSNGLFALPTGAYFKITGADTKMSKKDISAIKSTGMNRTNKKIDNSIISEERKHRVLVSA